MHSLQAKAWNVIYSIVKQGTQTYNRQMWLERTRTFFPFDYILPLNCLVTVRLPKMARACINIKHEGLFIRARPLCLLVTKYHASLKMSYNIYYTIYVLSLSLYHWSRQQIQHTYIVIGVPSTTTQLLLNLNKSYYLIWDFKMAARLYENQARDLSSCEECQNFYANKR